VPQPREHRWFQGPAPWHRLCLARRVASAFLRSGYAADGAGFGQRVNLPHLALAHHTSPTTLKKRVRGLLFALVPAGGRCAAAWSISSANGWPECQWPMTPRRNPRLVLSTNSLFTMDPAWPAADFEWKEIPRSLPGRARAYCRCWNQKHARDALVPAENRHMGAQDITRRDCSLTARQSLRSSKSLATGQARLRCSPPCWALGALSETGDPLEMAGARGVR